MLGHPNLQNQKLYFKQTQAVVLQILLTMKDCKKKHTARFKNKQNLVTKGPGGSLTSHLGQGQH